MIVSSLAYSREIISSLNMFLLLPWIPLDIHLSMVCFSTPIIVAISFGMPIRGFLSGCFSLCLFIPLTHAVISECLWLGVRYRQRVFMKS